MRNASRQGVETPLAIEILDDNGNIIKAEAHELPECAFWTMEEVKHLLGAFMDVKSDV